MRHGRVLHLAQNLFAPWQGRYNVLGAEGLNNAFGVGKIQSTRLQAATRRIAEQFLVYEAMEQALLEHEEQHDFGRIVEVDERMIQSLDRENLMDLRRFLFRRYVLPTEGLKEYVERAELVPQEHQLSQEPQDVRSRLLKLLSAEKPALGEIAACLADAQNPDLNMFKMAISRLRRRGYFGPAQVVLDNLVMSRMQLDSELLVMALDLAAISGNRKLFLNYASIGIGRGESLAKRFDVDRGSPENVLVSVAQGAIKFHEDEILTNALKLDKDSLTLHLLNLRAATRWRDNKRLDWTKKHLPANWRLKASPSLIDDLTDAFRRAEKSINGV